MVRRRRYNEEQSFKDLVSSLVDEYSDDDTDFEKVDASSLTKDCTTIASKMGVKSSGNAEQEVQDVLDSKQIDSELGDEDMVRDRIKNALSEGRHGSSCVICGKPASWLRQDPTSKDTPLCDDCMTGDDCVEYHDYDDPEEECVVCGAPATWYIDDGPGTKKLPVCDDHMTGDNCIAINENKSRKNNLFESILD